MGVYHIHVCNGRGQVWEASVGDAPVTFVDDITQYMVSSWTEDICIDGIFCSPAVTSGSMCRVVGNIGIRDYEIVVASPSRIYARVPIDGPLIGIDIYPMRMEPRLKL